MRELRDRLRQETFLAEVRRQNVEGYKLIGGFEGGRLVALAGIGAGRTRSPAASISSWTTW